MADKTAKKQEIEETHPADNIKKYRWPKGVSGNPKGRPKGKLSPIDNIRQMFEKSPEDFNEFLTDYLNDSSNRKHIIEMLDGRPMQRIDHSSLGKELPTPILNVHTNNSYKESNGDEEEDKGSPRGNISK